MAIEVCRRHRCTASFKISGRRDYNAVVVDQLPHDQARLLRGPIRTTTSIPSSMRSTLRSVSLRSTEILEYALTRSRQAGATWARPNAIGALIRSKPCGSTWPHASTLSLVNLS
jgi:hypothetical protein